MRWSSLILAAAMCAPAARAADDELRALRQEVEALRDAVQGLERRIQSLEEHRAEAKAPASGASIQPEARSPEKNAAASAPSVSVASVRVGWSRVAKGMLKQQVKEVLGAASGEMTINGKLVWYYVYPGIGNGSVFFNADGRVSSWQPPTGGW